MKVDPKALDLRESHEFLTSSVAPRPIAFVSTVGEDGIFNLAPYSFLAAIAVKPMLVGFTIGRKRSGDKKDTLLNIEFSGDFVINVVTENLAEAMNQTSKEYPRSVDEFAQVGLTAIRSDIIKSPMVKESPINMECRLVQLVEFGEAPRYNSFVIGEVVNIHVKEEIFVGNKIDFSRLKAIGRMGGESYCRTADTFEMKRPDPFG